MGAPAKFQFFAATGRFVAGMLTVLVPAQGAWAGELRGLLIGVDEYPRLGPAARLEGAVNDARDIAEALKRNGAAEVVPLVDGEGVDQTSVVPVVSKWATLKWLQAHAKGAPGQFILHSGNQRYKPGSEISLSFEGAELPYLTLFNLAPDGRVEFFVEPFEVNLDWRGRKAEWKFRPDKPPFGSAHMVAVLTEEPLSDLHNALKSMSSADRAVGLRNLTEAVFGERRFQLGVIGIYTGEGG